MSTNDVSNSTYRIRNIGKDNKCLTLTGAVAGTLIVVKDKQGDDTQKWVLRKQGFGGPGYKAVTLQHVDDMGFCAADKQAAGHMVKYTKSAWVVRLKPIGDDYFTIHYTQGDKNLVLSTENEGNDVVLSTLKETDAKQQWSFEEI